MRIAFVLNNLSGGGAERVAVNVANTLASMGHDVTLILNFKRGPYLADVTPEVKILELGQRMLRALPKLIMTLRRARFEAVLTVLDQPSIACLLVKPFIGPTKVIVVECNNPLASDAGVTSHVWKAIRALRAKLYPKADHIIAKSEGIRSALVSNFNCTGAKITAIANPLDLTRVERMKTEPADLVLPETDKRPLLIAVGRLSFQKDFGTLIDAVALLQKRRSVRLVILGEGDLRQELEAKIAQLDLTDSVSLPGFVSNPYALIAQSDAFVLSSRWEGWPNALVEALACGAQVVSTDCESGPREILVDGQFGALVPIGDSPAMADALEKALDTDTDTDALVRHVSSFSPQTIAAKYAEIIQKAITS